MTKPTLARTVGGILIWLKEEIKNRIILCRICNMDIDKSQGTDHNRSDDMVCPQKIIQAIIQMPRSIGWEPVLPQGWLHRRRLHFAEPTCHLSTNGINIGTVVRRLLTKYIASKTTKFYWVCTLQNHTRVVRASCDHSQCNVHLSCHTYYWHDIIKQTSIASYPQITSHI